MKELLVVLVTVIGGLGVFLIGLKHLSEGLQAVAAPSLRRLMSFAGSRNPFVRTWSGAASTMLVQSSSIITVMLVGFVSTGAVALSQAVNVIVGANIGTTATVWLLALMPSPVMVAYSCVGLGAVLYFFVSKEFFHNFGLALLGFGMLFLSMDFLNKGLLYVAAGDGVSSLLAATSVESFAGAAVVALAAALAASLLQSSAALIALIMCMASLRLISYETAIVSLLGANVGTTVAAWNVAAGAGASARRTALVNTLSNLAGSLVLLPFAIPVFAPLSKAVFPHWGEAVSVTASGGAQITMLPGIMLPIAFADTVFAILRGVLLLPFGAPLATLAEKIVYQSEAEKPHLSSLKIGVKLSPVIACDQALSEIDFMKESCLGLLACAGKVLAGDADESDERYIARREAILDNVQREVTEFLGDVMTRRLPQDVAERARRLLRLTDELESVSDEAAQVLKVVKRLRRQQQRISDASKDLLSSVHSRVHSFAVTVTPLIRSPRPEIDLVSLQAESKNIREYIRDCRKIQLGRVGADDPDSPLRVLCELDIMNAFDRVRSCYVNIAETLAGGKQPLKTA
jgi:phosphate:Na+ symporter